MPFIPDEQPQEKKDNSFFSNLLGIGSRILTAPSDIVGGILKSGREFGEGTFKAPDIPGGKFILPTLVGAVRGLKERTPAFEEAPKILGIDPESPAGLGVGLAAEIATPDLFDIIPFARIASKIRKPAVKALEKSSEFLVLKGIKPSKTQLADFSKKTGKELGEFVKSRNLAGNVGENVLGRINKLQGEYDDIVQNAGVRVNIQDISTAISNKINDLQAGLFGKTSNKTVIRTLNEMRDELASKITSADGVVNLDEVVDARRALDKQIPKSAWAKLFAGDDIPAKLATRNILQDIINESAESVTGGSGMGLRQLGKELQGLYSVEKIADLQSKLGKGSNIIGLQTGLALIAGASTGENVKQRVKNAVITAVGVNVANNPRVISALSNLVSKGAKILNTNNAAKFIELILRIGKEDVIKGVRPPEEEGFSPNSQ